MAPLGDDMGKLCDAIKSIPDKILGGQVPTQWGDQDDDKGDDE